MRLRSVSSGFFTGIPSLRRIIRLFQTLYDANQIEGSEQLQVIFHIAFSWFGIVLRKSQANIMAVYG